MVANLVQNAVTDNERAAGSTCRCPLVRRWPWRNSGAPLPSEAVPAPFEPLGRLSTDRAVPRGGAGLGLSIKGSGVTANGGSSGLHLVARVDLS
jgi:hypothetical protein